MTIVEAYAVCTGIAQREAKNFYYSFRVLPEPKRDAMCAVYAFMRRADDISDEETMPVVERRVVMSEWLSAWREARRSGVSDDPVFVALNDTQKRFAIPDALLEDLVRGTTMDLEESQADVILVTDTVADKTQTLQVYEDFEGLYRYCYLVASVVGLVCIRIFGYSDPRAEVLAEKTGVAFQLTNILRDVSEDAERGRIYLPLQDLTAGRVEVKQLLQVVRREAETKVVRSLLAQEAARALMYYAAAEELLPLIDKDSRAALWVLVTIYRGLLERIMAKNYDVFSERVSVPTSRKLLILAQGMGMAVRNRMVL
ncbi:phytoene/squalene synthase family protein [Tunturibacter empetritectus]|uniref:Phytoene synthase n=1 Tax=Tunturiibacter lichenicola TaxID=2051959 RepID=A0A7W8JDA0_9BACT|nr:phytoene/squalene synthase family protein [Edaphobacter lichenicola]MBB5345749.1 phytoene synthase [Edaphobacter lichenicola]